MTSPPARTWVVGAGGLLGSRVAARVRPAQAWSPGEAVPWGTPSAGRALAAQAGRFLDQVGDDPWQVVWCAGAGVTSTSREALAREAEPLRALTEALARSRRPHDGALFLASSAGGVYAGSPGAPFDETTRPRPISPYGEAKLEHERLATDLHREHGVPVLVGRVSNLYGPGQDLGKAQGLISQVVRAHLLGRPISVYVPLDTVRDNLFVSDAARLVLGGLDRLREESAASGPQAVVKVVASQQGVTVGFLIAELGRILKRRLHVVYGASSSAAFQARDLRMRSVVWPELDRTPVTPLPVGMRRVVDALAGSLRAGRLA